LAYLYECEVFDAADIRVRWGINQDEGLGIPAEAHEGDIYALQPGTLPIVLHLNMGETITLAGSAGAGAPVTVHAEMRLMSSDGELVSAMLIEARDRLYLLPLSPMRVDTGYSLISLDEDSPALRMSELVLGCFGPGTRITMGDGELLPVEMLEPGMQVRTRDHGAQPLRWVGKLTKRAHGSFAPVTFPPGMLGNLGPLTLGPLQRIFLYQRGERQLGSRPEVLVQAQYLVDGTRVLQREGGYATHYSLVFDQHQIIYAEGIPVESLLVSRASVARLPETLASDLAERFPGLNQRAHFAQEVPASMVTPEMRAALLQSKEK
jgi:hypothetical protein